MDDLLKILSEKAPYFHNRLGDMKLEEYRENLDVSLLKDAVIEFKKANASGFLIPRHARRSFEEDIRSKVNLESIFSSEELAQLERLGASTSSDWMHAEVVEMTPENEVVELIESERLKKLSTR